MTLQGRLNVLEPVLTMFNEGGLSSLLYDAIHLRGRHWGNCDHYNSLQRGEP